MADREERLMMRQRGAGTRQVKDLGFDLVLPDQSTSPLKPRKSGRAQKTPQPELASQKPLRKTPKTAKTSALPKPEMKLGALPAKTEENEGEQDILCLDVLGKNEQLITARKRKLDKDGGSEGPATKKTRKPTRRPPGVSRTTALKDRPSDAASTRKAPEEVESIAVENRGVDDEGSAVAIQKETVKVMEQGSRVRAQIVEQATTSETKPEVEGEVVKPTTRTGKKPIQRKRLPKLDDTKDLVDHGPHDQQDLDREKVALTVTPPKKRKKRRSIGQQSTKRVKRSTNDARHPISSSRSNHETSDLVNELLDSTIEIAPEKPRKDPLPSQKSVKASKPQTMATTQETPAPNTDVIQKSPKSTAPAANALALKVAKNAQEQPPKSKPRKKRRAIAQVKRPKKRATLNVDVQERNSLPKTEDDVEPTPDAVQPSIITKVPGSRSGARPSKPLSDITNSTPKLVLQRTEPKPAEAPSQNSVPAKKRGRPRKNAVIESREISDPQDAAGKPAGKPRTASATKSKTTLGKTMKATARTQKGPKGSVPAIVPAIPDDLDLDSDDPLSGEMTIRPKRIVKPVEALAQVSSESLGRRDGKVLKKKANALRAEGQDHTPKTKGTDLEKRKELEQKEIDELLGSIRKAVRKGRGMVAGES